MPELVPAAGRALPALRRLGHRVGADVALALASRDALARDRRRADGSVRGTAAQAWLLCGWLRSRLGREEIALEHEPAEKLEGVALDGEAVPLPPGDPPDAERRPLRRARALHAGSGLRGRSAGRNAVTDESFLVTDCYLRSACVSGTKPATHASRRQNDSAGVPLVRTTDPTAPCSCRAGVYRPSYEQVRTLVHIARRLRRQGADPSRPLRWTWPFESSRRTRSCSISWHRRRSASEIAHHPSDSLLRGRTGPTRPGRTQRAGGRRPGPRASSPAASGELDRGGQPVLRRAARERERRPAERAERIRERDARRRGSRARPTSAGGATNGTRRRHDAGRARRPPPRSARGTRRGRARPRPPRRRSRARQRSILPRTFSPYSSSFPGKSARWTSADLAHEVRSVRRRERELDLAPAREERRRLRHALAHERVRLGRARRRRPRAPRATRARPARSRARARAAAARSPRPTTPSARRCRSSARAGSSPRPRRARASA